MKFQVIIDKKDRITSTVYGLGKEHDYRMLQRSLPHIDPSLTILVDRGYEGIDKLYPDNNILIPQKNYRNKPLTSDDLLANNLISSFRIRIEHVFAKLKIFRILQGLYRGSKLSLVFRFNLIAGLYNYEIEN